jgi:hypothetical protein
MKNLFTAAAVIASFASASFAGGIYTGTPINDFIEPAHKYDSSINGTVPGVNVVLNGETSHYALGELGLTRSVAFDDTGVKLEAWAATALGADVTARLDVYRGDQ